MCITIKNINVFFIVLPEFNICSEIIHHNYINTVQIDTLEKLIFIHNLREFSQITLVKLHCLIVMPISSVYMSFTYLQII